mmetsp:Transcript_10323/g.23553  ORF Transcript_10323/g.23553 Transcript_10323/m.23553 type:complete len:227 (-) Transcript_10323:883-1563(-)
MVCDCSLLLLGLHFLAGRGERQHDKVGERGSNVAEVVKVTPVLNGRCPGQEHEWLDKVVDDDGGAEEGQHVIQGLEERLASLSVLLEEVRTNLGAAHTSHRGEEGRGHEEHVVARVEAVPEGGDGVGPVESEAAILDTLEHGALQPGRRAHVPEDGGVSEVHGELEPDWVRICDAVPLGLPSGLVHTVIAKACHDTASFSKKPSEVVLEAEHHVDDPNASQLLKEG